MTCMKLCEVYVLVPAARRLAVVCLISARLSALRHGPALVPPLRRETTLSKAVLRYICGFGALYFFVFVGKLLCFEDERRYSCLKRSGRCQRCESRARVTAPTPPSPPYLPMAASPLVKADISSVVAPWRAPPRKLFPGCADPARSTPALPPAGSRPRWRPPRFLVVVLVVVVGGIHLRRSGGSSLSPPAARWEWARSCRAARGGARRPPGREVVRWQGSQ